MLNYRTIEYKPLQRVIGADGKSVVSQDMLAKTWSEYPYEPYINPIVVNEYYVARPDLISLAVYGSDEYGDMICKFNGISNPFELNEGMLLFIPPVEWATVGTADRETSSNDLISDGATIEQKDRLKKLRSDARSSSTATVGDDAPFVIDKTLGMVFY